MAQSCERQAHVPVRHPWRRVHRDHRMDRRLARHDGLPLSDRGPGHQIWRQADRARRPGRRLHPRRPAGRRVPARPLHAGNQQHAGADPVAALGPRLSQPLQVRDLFRQHDALQRPEMGHQEPGHRARPRIRPGPHPRLRHLFDARDRSRQVHDRNRRHRWRIHPRRDQLPAAQRHRAGVLAHDRRVGHPGSGHGGEHRPVRPAGRQGDRPDGRRIRPDHPRILYRKHQPA